MKPFLGIDLTTDKKNEQINGREFLVATPSAALTESFQRSLEGTEEKLEQSKLPLPIRIGHWICGVLGLVITIGILKALGGEDGISLAEAYKNASWLFWLGGACLVAWALLKVISLRKEKKVLETDESSLVLEHLDKSGDALLNDLAVPPDAKEIDLLSFFYKIKDGKIKVCEKPLQPAPYMNPIFYAFADDEYLYLANYDGKYAFPLSRIKAIRTVKQIVRIMEWNKDEPHDKGIYKQYKIGEDQYGCITCKHYHILELEHDGELWGIYFPCYELPVILKLTGLTATEA